MARAQARQSERPQSGTESERFLEGFLLPFIQGGTVRVDRPLGAPALAALEAEALLPSEAVLAVEKARRGRAAGLWLYPVGLSWDPTSARLAAAVHNLLFLDHPDAERWTARSSRLRRVVSYTSSLLELPAPVDGAEAVSRHTVVGRLFDLQRDDVVLDTWLMLYHFRGQEPPRSLRRFPGVRRVREQHQRVRWVADERLSEAQIELCERLLRASPLTDLLTPARPRPAFAWPPLVEYLRWRPLCRLICQRYLEMGLAQVSPPLCIAFWDMLVPKTPGGWPSASGPGKPDSTAVRRVLGLLVYLCAVASLGSQPVPLGGGADPLGQLGTVLVAATECSLLPSVALEAPLQERLEKLAAEHKKTVGDETINDLAAKLRAALE